MIEAPIVRIPLRCIRLRASRFSPPVGGGVFPLPESLRSGDRLSQVGRVGRASHKTEREPWGLMRAVTRLPKR